MGLGKQDFPRLLPRDARVGFTRLDRWMIYSAVKNNMAEAVKKQTTTGVMAPCAASGEHDLCANPFIYVFGHLVIWFFFFFFFFFFFILGFVILVFD